MCSGPIFTLSSFSLQSLLLTPLSHGLSAQSKKMAAQPPVIYMVSSGLAVKRASLFLITHTQVLGCTLIGQTGSTLAPVPIAR